MADYSLRATLGAVDAGFTSAFKTATGAVSGLVGAVNSATKVIDKQMDAMKNSANSLNDTFSSITKKATMTLGGAGLAGLTASVKGFGDFEQAIEGAEKLFGKSSGKVIENAKRSFTTANTSAHEYLDQVTRFSASLLQGLAGDTEKAADYADTALTDMADNANTFGTELDSIQNAYQGFARGEYIMLDNLRLGYGGTAGEMARLINDSGVLKGVTLEAEDMIDVDLHTMIEAIHEIQKELEITGTTAYETDHTISGAFAGMRAASMNLLIGLADDNADIGQLYDDLLLRIEKFATNTMKAVGTVWDHMSHFHTLIYSLMGLSAIGGVLPIFSKANSAVFGLAGNLGMLGTAIKLAMAPMLLAGGGVIGGGLLVGGGALYETFQAEFDRVGSLIRTQGPGMILNLRNRIIDGIPRLAKSGTQLMTTITDSLVAILPALFDLGRNSVRSLVQGIINNKDEITKNLLKLMNVVIPELITLAPFLMDMGSKLMTALIQGFVNNKELGKEVGSNIKTALNESKDSLTGTFTDLGEFIEETIKPIFMNLLESLGERLIGIGEKAWEYLEPEFHRIMENIEGFFGENKDKMIDIGYQIGQAIVAGMAVAMGGKALASQIGGAIKNSKIVKTAGMHAKGGAQIIGGLSKQFLGTTAGTVGLAGVAALGVGYLYNKFRDTIGEFADNFANAVLSIDMEETMVKVGDFVKDFISDSVEGLITLLGDLIELVLNPKTWATVGKILEGILGIVLSILGGALIGLVEGVINGIGNALVGIGNSFVDLYNFIAEKFRGTFGLGWLGDKMGHAGYFEAEFNVDLGSFGDFIGANDPIPGGGGGGGSRSSSGGGRGGRGGGSGGGTRPVQIENRMNINNRDYDNFSSDIRDRGSELEDLLLAYPHQN